MYVLHAGRRIRVEGDRCFNAIVMHIVLRERNKYVRWQARVDRQCDPAPARRSVPGRGRASA
eukprot:8772474-Lingulodinium_polyedra.AAC.1